MLMLSLIVAIGLVFMLLERLFPDQEMREVPGWWKRVVIINAFQVLIVVLAGLTWDNWFRKTALFHLRDSVSPAAGGFIAYLVTTFIFYWWHRWRHTVNVLWLLCHQLHHSASRIETITSFYKHPLEITINSFIIGITVYTVLGLSPESAGWVSLFTSLAEFLYHMNIATPRWLGYFIQRPEMHRIHHRLGKHFSNFSDLPIWDMLFGTYENPHKYDGPCGFKPEREASFTKILSFRNVNGPYNPKKTGAAR